ncbi:pirin-like C-terminal cupin domain-containing protein [Eikenella longinqua]|nr:pirin-like C-terminal cupin domain-containing protein [Eikenella longinqua]
MFNNTAADFVMNTAEEIRQAVRDFNEGKFGRID